MYFRQTNPIALRSQYMISDAMLSLMKRTHFQKITVTQLCEEAAIGRKTFYRNFEVKEDVIDFQLDALYGEYLNDLSQIQLENYLHHHFSFLQKHMDYLKLLYYNGLLPKLTAKFSALLPQIMPRWTDDPVEQRYRSAYIAAGIEAITFVWAEGRFQKSVEEVTAIALRAQDRQIPLEK